MENQRKTKKQIENEAVLDKLQFGFSVQRIIHKGYEEYEKATLKMAKEIHKKTGFNLRQMFGKYQYILRSEKGEISVIKIRKFNFNKKSILSDTWNWEIWSNETLFPDTRIFRTKKDAFEVAKQYLL